MEKIKIKRQDVETKCNSRPSVYPELIGGKWSKKTRRHSTECSRIVATEFKK